MKTLINTSISPYTPHKMSIDISQEWRVVGVAAYCWAKYTLLGGSQGNYLLFTETEGAPTVHGFGGSGHMAAEIGQIDFYYNVNVLKDMGLE